MKDHNRNIAKSIAMAKEMIGLADEGQAESRDNGCLTLYGLVRDCGYRIKGEAERERDAHRASGVWSEAD